jgi:hypothetical protein
MLLDWHSDQPETTLVRPSQVKRSAGKFRTIGKQKKQQSRDYPQSLDRVFDLFLVCRDMDSEARNAWLREACGGDPLLQESEAKQGLRC